MSDEKRELPDAPDGELLPAREVLSLINPSGSGMDGIAGGLLGGTPDPTGGTDPTAAASNPGATPTGATTDLTSSAMQHVTPQPAGDGGQVSDQPQTVPVDSSQSASSET
jgi:hypothetical protein